MCPVPRGTVGALFVLGPLEPGLILSYPILIANIVLAGISENTTANIDRQRF